MARKSAGLGFERSHAHKTIFSNTVVGRFLAARSGAIAVQFALLLIPLIGAAGGAVDLATVYQLKTVLDNAADASAVASIAVESPAAIAARSMTSDGAIPEGVSDATKVFNANIASVKSYANVTLTPTVTKTGMTVSSLINYTAVMPTSFLNILGIPQWTIVGSSQASSNLVPYMDFYLLLDNTPSMAIAATQSGIDTMVALTQPEPYYSSTLNDYINNGNQQCAFACHDMSTAPNDFYTLAEINHVQKRIDVVAQATQNLMSTAQQDETMSGQFRMAIYTFGAAAEHAGLTNVAPLSSNLSAVSSEAATIDVMTVPNHANGTELDTDFDNILSSINAVIPNPGDGSSTMSRQQVLFFVTDGVADAHYPDTCSQPSVGGTRCLEPLTVADCTSIKNRGIKIAVLYTTYYPLPTNTYYNKHVAPWASEIPTNMQACASEGLYFEVSPSQGISQAMSALFSQTLQIVRLTQ